jgi:hypothetical protein
VVVVTSDITFIAEKFPTKFASKLISLEIAAIDGRVGNPDTGVAWRELLSISFAG